MRLIATIVSLAFAIAVRADPGVMVVDSLAGTVATNGTDQVLGIGDAIAPSGLDLTTRANGFASLVFSNGVALYLGPDTELRILEFEQIPFTAQPDDIAFEPSRSRLVVALVRGSLGIAQRQQNPTSDFVVELGAGFQAEISSRQATIISDFTGVTIALFEGRAQIQHAGQEHLLREGYRFLGKGGITGDRDQLREHLSLEREAWLPSAELAKVALDRWYFTTPSEGVVTPQRITPAISVENRRFNNTKL